MLYDLVRYIMDSTRCPEQRAEDIAYQIADRVDEIVNTALNDEYEEDKYADDDN